MSKDRYSIPAYLALLSEASACGLHPQHSLNCQISTWLLPIFCRCEARSKKDKIVANLKSNFNHFDLFRFIYLFLLVSFCRERSKTLSDFPVQDVELKRKLAKDHVSAISKIAPGVTKARGAYRRQTYSL